MTFAASNGITSAGLFWSDADLADIFLSYAREDRAIAERLASAIEASGKSVWWDRHIKGGAQFSKDIERELHAATHVLVLWSSASVESRWVRDEASHAADNNRLVGATIDGTNAPLGFGQFHTVDLRGWKKTGATLPDDLALALDADPVAPSPPSAGKPTRHKGLVIGGIAAALALAGIGAVALDLPEALIGEEDSHDLTIAVLPFVEQDDEGELGRSLASALLDGLGSSRGFDLVSSTSSFAQQTGTATEIAQRLGASHLVEGDLRQEGEVLRLTLRIVDGANGRPIWSHALEQQDGNRDELAARATIRLSAGIQAWLGVGSGSIGDTSGVPESAVEEYRRGLEEMIAEDGGEAYLGAFHHFGSAAERAPDWAPAHGARALTMMQFGPNAVALDVDEFLELQVSTYSRALEIDPNDPWARTARAGHLLFAETEIDASIEELRDVTADYPDLVQPQYMLSAALILAAEYREALTVIDRSIALSPPARNTLAMVRISALRGLDRYWDIERMGRECRAQCNQLTSSWLQAILAQEDVSEAWVERRIERFDDLLARIGSSETTRAQYKDGIRYWHLGGSEPDLRLGPGIVGAAFAARKGDFDLAFERISYIGEDGAPSVLASNFVHDDGLELPEAMRRDPRYAELFDRGRFKDVEAYRREKGVLSGLPIRDGNQ